MHLPNDALERMSRGQRSGLLKLLSENNIVPQDKWVEVEKLMNEQGLGWCEKHMCWHTIDLTLSSTTGPFAPPHHGCARFLNTNVQHLVDQLLKGTSGSLPQFPYQQQSPDPFGVGKLVQQQQNERIERRIQEMMQVEPFREQVERMKRQAEQQQKIQEAMERLAKTPPPLPKTLPSSKENAIEELLNKIEKGGPIAEALQKMLEKEKQHKKEAEEASKKRQKWLFKIYNQCPDCGNETVTHERRSGPEPQDALDKIVYANEPCGCKNLGTFGGLTNVPFLK